MKPLISVCLPNLNTRQYLPPRMESILNQTNTDWELVIFDNFSTDGSWEYFQDFKNHPQIRLFQAPKQGMYANWNNCLREARGKYVHIATSDDVEEPGFQATLANLLESNDGCPVAYCEFREMDAEGVIDQERPLLRHYLFEPAPVPMRRPWESEFLHALALWGPWITLNAVLFRRDLLEKTGYFPLHLGSMGDVLWSIRACFEGDTVYSPEIQAYWRRHPAQASPSDKADHRDAVMSRTMIPEGQKFLTENLARVPAEWKSVKNWRKKAQAFRFKEAREYSGFDRGTLFSNPQRFLAACKWFMRNDPKYFWGQMATFLPYRHNVFGVALGFGESLGDKPLKFQLPDQTPARIGEPTGRAEQASVTS